MFDERTFIARVESANTDELVRLLIAPTAQEEKAFRAYFGDELYQRLRLMALKSSFRRGERDAKGNVVVIHGIMGSELTAINRAGAGEQLWLKVLRIINGKLDLLRLGDDGRTEYNPDYDIRASGILKRYYGKLLLALSESWNVRAFWFDWRKDLRLAADELQAQISGWFGDDAPVHIVAHSMGGLVARTFIKKHPQRWEAMWDRQSNGKAGGRLIMLGTPNHGSFDIPQVITGLQETVRKLNLIDIRHRLTDLQTILNSFVGSYQMLPSPFVMESMEPLYKSETYGDLQVPQRHLDNAWQHHKWLSDVVDAERMIYIAGYNQPTFSNINDLIQLKSIDAYEVTMDGDGNVPHTLGLLTTPDGRGIKTYYIQEKHGSLPANRHVLSALNELLEEGTTEELDDKMVSRRSIQEDEVRKQQVLKQLVADQTADEEHLLTFVRHANTRSAEPISSPYLTSEERKAEESLINHFLSYPDDWEQHSNRYDVPVEPICIEIGLEYGKIEEITDKNIGGEFIDAISVGHYFGVQPQAAELALDKAISRTLPYNQTDTNEDLSETQLLLTQYADRGIIRGELGQPFFLNDPRTTQENNVTRVDRTIAIAGLGVPGRFGVPELTVLVRELSWSLGQMGKRHLATVLIGGGNGNLSIDDAISGWLRGVKHAVTGMLESERRHLKRITFVESDPRKIESIQNAILSEQSRLEPEKTLIISYKKISKDQLEELRRVGRELTIREWERELDKQHRGRNTSNKPIPTRITLSLERRTYRFGAITETASIPEREIPLDPSLVRRANEELVAESNPVMQLERGQFMERLLVPGDLRAQLFTDAPIVMMLDATTARIHWEIIAQSNLTTPGSSNPNRDKRQALEYFLGTSRGFTRQLRTTFAPPPEPTLPSRRILRVLVVADPAQDAHLPKAEQEGYELTNLFEEFNTVYNSSDNRVEVVGLFGPREATRTNVLRYLMLHSYDVLHFAGHCIYNKDDPASSGWIFANGECLGVNELNRIDRIPHFVFSNACESGITPDRSEERSVKLAPSFAEAFFARGVSNFVCTAWPVYDSTALQFALRLYSGLLGLRKVENQVDRYTRTNLETMYIAMREARRAIAETSHDVRSWGAYQHYGNPFFRFFNETTMNL